MANAYFNALSDANKASSFSAGTQPGNHVHPVVKEVCVAEAIPLYAAVRSTIAHPCISEMSRLPLDTAMRAIALVPCIALMHRHAGLAAPCRLRQYATL